MRIFLNDETRRTKFSLSYADKNMNNMLLDEFYNNVVLKQDVKELRYVDLKRQVGCNKDIFLRRDNVRNMGQISYRLLSFIFYSHLFISRILGYINDEDLKIFTIKDMTLFQVLEANWDMIQDLSKINIREILNILYGQIYQLFTGVDYFPTVNSFQTFENIFDQKIKNNINNTKEISEYESMNSALLSFEPFSDMAIINELFPPFIYKEEIFPCIGFFRYSIIPSILSFKQKFLINQNSEDKYP